MHLFKNINSRDDDAAGSTPTQGVHSTESRPANTPGKTRSERIVIMLLLIICCFAFGSNLLR